MGTRRKARELALQALFYIDANPVDPETMIELFCRSRQPSKKTRPFFLDLTNGVIGNRLEIDEIIQRFSSNWKVSRMPCVDRNILRIAVFELLSCPDIPPKVSINEAIDIGKKYGTEESGAFINGILDSIHFAMEKEDLVLTGKQSSISWKKHEKKAALSENDHDRFPAEKIHRVKGSKGIVKRKGS